MKTQLSPVVALVEEWAAATVLLIMGSRSKAVAT